MSVCVCVCVRARVRVRLCKGVAVYVALHACARACVRARVFLCIGRTLALAFVVTITHVNTHVFFSCPCVCMCACALSGITSESVHGVAVRSSPHSSPYRMSLQAFSRVCVCVPCGTQRVWIRGLHGSMMVANVMCYGGIKRARSAREDSSIYIYIYIHIYTYIYILCG